MLEFSHLNVVRHIIFYDPKVQYECGNYTGASEYLYFHRILVQPTDANYLNGMWGKLAAEILLQNWDTALEDLNRLKQFIDESTFGSSLQTLQQRTWLIHWSLFVFFNHPKVLHFLFQ
jgi:translation initiation factor 3 subunit E